MLQTFDPEGYAVPFASDDQYIECEACDPDAGEPDSWPAWTDTWTFAPTEADEAWLAEQNQDWAGYVEWSRRLDEMAEASQFLDRLEQINGPHYHTDEDLQAAGLACG